MTNDIRNLTDDICTDIFDNCEPIYRAWLGYADECPDDRELSLRICDDMSERIIGDGLTHFAGMFIELVWGYIDWMAVARYVRDAQGVCE